MFLRAFALICLSFSVFAQAPPPFVTCYLQGQLGNQLFQIAAAYVYALDHKVDLIIPDLVHQTQWNVKYNAEKLFIHKIAHHELPVAPVVWKEPSHNFSPIPSCANLQLFGWFQSEKYFQHRRKEILELFSPPPALLEKVVLKYPALLSDAMTVAVQIRDYRAEQPRGEYHPTHGRAYYKQAMEQFPENTLFFVSSNNLDFAMECTDGLSDHIVYVELDDDIEEFYALSLCKSFIISNSSFGWWAAWLSRFPQKKVFVPRPWFTPPFEDATRDRFSEGWQIIYNDSHVTR